MAGRAIGIDLGTTFSCAAIVEGRKPQVVRSRLGYTTLPSVVTFDAHGEAVVGHEAERGMVLRPKDTIYGSKRLLGRSFLPGVLARFQPHFQYQLVADPDGFVAAHVCGRTVSFVDVAALILREMRRAAESGLGRPVERAVVTVPAYFNENQRAFVREAGRRAELDVIRVINEPTAAALCFGFNRAERKRLLVFDLGGGTFDVSIVELDGNVFQVVGTDGDTFLGGIDFDDRLAAHLLDRLGARGKQPIELDAVGRQRIRAAAQEAKHQLSVQQTFTVSIPALTLADGSRIDVAEPVSRPELEEITRSLLDGTLAVVSRALDAAGLRPADIDDVLLVGGQTRMPVVARRLRDLFDKEPTKRIHPDEVVAQGAAIAAESHDRFDAVVLRDVVPLAIGIAEPDGRMTPVIARNTRIPHEATATVAVPPGLESLKLAVFQGGSAQASGNEYLGALVVDGLPRRSEPVDCRVAFRLDAECLLHLHAAIPALDIDREVTLVTQHTPDQVLGEMGRERVLVVTPLAPRPPAPGPISSRPAPVAGPPAAARPGWFGRLLRRLRLR